MLSTHTRNSSYSICECSAAADRCLSDRPATLKHRIPFERMQGFSAGTHHAFPRLQWQPSGHPMPEANERQFGLPFICAGWFTGTIQHGRLAKSRAADCCSILQSAARAKRFSKAFPIACVFADRILNRFHSTISTAKPVEHDCRLSENLKFTNRTSSWKDRCVGHRAASRLSRKRWHQNVGTMFPIILNPPGRNSSPKGNMCL